MSYLTIKMFLRNLFLYSFIFVGLLSLFLKLRLDQWTEFLSENGSQLVLNSLNSLIIVAHPDDESMFFTPLVANLPSEKTYVVSLSSGNYDGLGPVRAQEFKNVCHDILKIPRDNIEVVLDKNLKDGPNEVWKDFHVSKQIDFFISARKINISSLQMFSFDNYGVSGHTNHRNTYIGVRRWVASTSGNAKFFALKSVPLMEKFFWFLQHPPTETTADLTFTLNSSDLALRAMKGHESQFVWFRRLFIQFSRYSYFNEFNAFS